MPEKPLEAHNQEIEHDSSLDETTEVSETVREETDKIRAKTEEVVRSLEYISPREVFERMLESKDSFHSADAFRNAYADAMAESGILLADRQAHLQKRSQEIANLYSPSVEVNNQQKLSDIFENLKERKNNFKNSDQFMDTLVEEAITVGVPPEAAEAFCDEFELTIQKLYEVKRTRDYRDPFEKNIRQKEKGERLIRDFRLPEIPEKKRHTFEKFETFLPSLEELGVAPEVQKELVDQWQQRKQELFDEWNVICEQQSRKKKEKTQKPWTQQFLHWIRYQYRSLKNFLTRILRRRSLAN